MLQDDRKEEIRQKKEKIRQRYRAEIDEDNYLYIPAKKQADYYDTEVHQRIAIYVRVSTDDVRQTTSYELQKKYVICHHHNIPFSVVEKEFSSREEAIAWICANQLGRRNISEETRKFLIGKQYEARRQCAMNHAQETDGTIHTTAGIPWGQAAQPGEIRVSRHITAETIAVENNVSPSTVQKYAVYSKAMEKISSMAPSLAERILSGQYKISHENVLLQAKKTPRELHRIEKQINAHTGPFVQYKNTRPVIADSQWDGRPKKNYKPTVKDMPAFDPNAAITSLYLTIPSWTDILKRAINDKVTAGTSEKAQQNLKNALTTLIDTVNNLLGEIEGQ